MFIHDKVMTVKKEGTSFYLKTENNIEWEAKTIFLATGLVDHLPKLANL